ncbi:hypothetical protein BaRGS_00034361 [Batillaria attramentaria]|uniref:Uncharacterized protein n=1 Tax=Batillaria attramentaria TaxID=370345 RepID=A0ABD0JIZ5_9CAEN
MAMDKLWKVMLAPSILLLCFCLDGSTGQGRSTGGWGEWSPLSGCSKSCDMGIQTRWREWLTGQGEQPLENPYTNTEQYSCFQQACPQNGSWSEWGMWGQCTVACGGGVRKRHRDCNNPPPSNGGNECEGHKYDEEECKTLPCPPVPPNFNLSQCRHDGMVMCDNKVMCVSKSSRCDGTVQCSDGTDEMDCRRYGSGYGLGRVHYSRSGAAGQFVLLSLAVTTVYVRLISVTANVVRTISVTVNALPASKVNLSFCSLNCHLAALIKGLCTLNDTRADTDKFVFVCFFFLLLAINSMKTGMFQLSFFSLEPDFFQFLVD